MSDLYRSFAPRLTSQGGACLTLANWQQIGVDQAIFSVEALIVKPGIEVLKSFQDLKHYTGWTGRVILEVDLKVKTASGDYAIRSPYDGSLIQLSELELLDFIEHLKADEVIWFEADLHLWAWDPDKPAADAIQGLIYSQSGEFSLLDLTNRAEFSLLDQACQCPTCTSGLTRAYLHYLLQHTPLLAQRYLVMHNIFQFKTTIASSAHPAE